MTDFCFPPQASVDETLSALRMQRAKAFVASYPSPPEWNRDIKRLLPPTGPIANGKDFVLVVIKEAGRDAYHPVFALTASDLCTPERCKEGNVSYPDALHNGCWRDHVPTMIGNILPARVALVMEDRGLLKIPENWSLDFVARKVSVGASR